MIFTSPIIDQKRETPQGGADFRGTRAILGPEGTKEAMKRVFLALACALLFTVGAHASGGTGGVFVGTVEPAWSTSFLPLPGDRMPFNLEYCGGYGFGVDDEGVITGGFGLAFLDSDILNPGGSSSHIAGGAGGLVVGDRVIGSNTVHLDVAFRLGAGGCYVDYAGTGDNRKGYAIVYVEPYAELGLGLTSWMHLAATAGFQMMGNIGPGSPFSDFLVYSPTLGFSITFGSFYF
jgi:hypothetical protein